MSRPRPDLPTDSRRLADLPKTKPTEFALAPDAAETDAICRALALDGLRKLRFEGRLVPEGSETWRLEAHLGATVVQPCVVTLAPVTTRIEADVTRRYLKDLPEPTEDEVEMPEDETLERLPRTLDLYAVLVEALALNLPLYPRAEGAELGEAVFAAPGVTPLRDEDTRPFAGLDALRRQLRDETADEEDAGADDAGGDGDGGGD